MDGKRFDALTKAMTTGRPSRRAALKGLVGSALAALLARVGPEEAGAAAICKQGGQRCDRDRECCSRDCSARGRCRPCGKEEGPCTADSRCGPEDTC